MIQQQFTNSSQALGQGVDASVPVPKGSAINVHVEGISYAYRFTEADLKKVFQRFGYVTGVQVQADGDSATVWFLDACDANQAIRELGGKSLNGEEGKLMVYWAQQDLGSVVGHEPNDPNARPYRKYTCRIDIGLQNEENFSVAKKLIGIKGANMKLIVQETGSKLRLRGKDSGYLEGEEQKESDEPLHLCISCTCWHGYQQAKKMAMDVIQLTLQEYKHYKLSCGLECQRLHVKVTEHPVITENTNRSRNFGGKNGMKSPAKGFGKGNSINAGMNNNSKTLSPRNTGVTLHNRDENNNLSEQNLQTTAASKRTPQSVGIKPAYNNYDDTTTPMLGPDTPVKPPILTPISGFGNGTNASGAASGNNLQFGSNLGGPNSNGLNTPANATVGQATTPGVSTTTSAQAQQQQMASAQQQSQLSSSASQMNNNPTPGMQLLQNTLNSCNSSLTSGLGSGILLQPTMSVGSSVTTTNGLLSTSGQQQGQQQQLSATNFNVNAASFQPGSCTIPQVPALPPMPLLPPVPLPPLNAQGLPMDSTSQMMGGGFVPGGMGITNGSSFPAPFATPMAGPASGTSNGNGGAMGSTSGLFPNFGAFQSVNNLYPMSQGTPMTFAQGQPSSGTSVQTTSALGVGGVPGNMMNTSLSTNGSGSTSLNAASGNSASVLFASPSKLEHAESSTPSTIADENTISTRGQSGGPEKENHQNNGDNVVPQSKPYRPPVREHGLLDRTGGSQTEEQNEGLPAGCPTPTEIERLVEKRNEARRVGNYKEADAIRHELHQKGVALMDEPGGRGRGNDVTTWRYFGPGFENNPMGPPAPNAGRGGKDNNTGYGSYGKDYHRSGTGESKFREYGTSSRYDRRGGDREASYASRDYNYPSSGQKWGSASRDDDTRERRWDSSANRAEPDSRWEGKSRTWYNSGDRAHEKSGSSSSWYNAGGNTTSTTYMG
ncbi:unnamed protein product [Amoebophrya sp. A120]|nr:unnamed protein product [Amoebophrya sp. A120]|eukprot:GSA120T00008680001.1